MGFLDKLSSKQKGMLLAILAALGVLLVILGIFSEKKDSEAVVQKNISGNYETLEYITRLENKISNILTHTVGKVNTESIAVWYMKK